MSELYLLPQEDGLPMRKSQEYAKDKLRILERYINRFAVSMQHKNWRALFYIDTMAGPGKNFFKPSGEVGLGSPLLALESRQPFTHYRFIEKEPEYCEALEKRISTSQRFPRAKVIQGDCNIMVDEIVTEIQGLNKPYIAGKKPCLGLAFLDPEGLKQLNWELVRKLGQLRIDLIINVSTNGFTRNAEKLLDKEETTSIDRFFGTLQWKDIYRNIAEKDNTIIRRTMLDFYKSRLESLGYVSTVEHTPDEQVFKNSKNAQVYTLIFACKHKLGVDFWHDVLQEVSQPKLI